MASYYINGYDNGKSEALCEMPDTSSSKSDFVDALERGFARCMNNRIPIDFNWLSYFSGWSANCKEVYVLTKPYAIKIGYRGPVATFTPMFIIVTSKHLKRVGKELVPR